MSSFAEMRVQPAPNDHNVDVADLEGGGAALLQLPDDVTLFSPYHYSRNMIVLPAKATNPKLKAGASPYTPFPSDVTQGVLDSISRDFSSRDSDVFVVYYPNSGGGMVAEMFSQIVFNETCGEGGLARGITEGEKVLHIEKFVAKYEKGVPAAVAYLNNMPRTVRRVFRTHVPRHYLLQWSNAKSKIVYIGRNPKDVAISMHHATLAQKEKYGYEGGLEHFLQQVFLPGRAEYGSWWRHVGSYWKMANWSALVQDTEESGPDCFCMWYVRERNLHSLCVRSALTLRSLCTHSALTLALYLSHQPVTHTHARRYESIIHNPVAAVEGLSEYVGAPVTKAKAGEIAEMMSFKVMRRAEDEGGVLGVDASKYAGKFVRRGGVGTWKDVVTVRVNERFDRVHARCAGDLQGQGVELQWDKRSTKKSEDERVTEILEGLDGGDEAAGGCVVA